MYKAILAALMVCCLMTNDVWARGGGRGGGGGGGRAAVAGRGGAVAGRGGYAGGYGRGGYGYGRGYGYGFGGGFGLGLGLGLYAGYPGYYGYGYPGYASYYYAPSAPTPYPYPYPYPVPSNPQDGPVPPMPLPTFAANTGAPRTPRPDTSVLRPANPGPAKAVVVGNANSAPVQLEIMVPDSAARVWVEGKLTSTTGRDRIYMTAPLEKGYAYTYNVRAVWNEGSQQVTMERQVEVTPGTARSVDFTSPDAPAQATPVLPPPTVEK